MISLGAASQDSLPIKLVAAGQPAADDWIRCPRTSENCAPRGEQLLDREGGLVIGGRDLHHGQARHGYMRVMDLPHAWHDVPTPPEVLSSERLHPTGYTATRAC